MRQVHMQRYVQSVNHLVAGHEICSSFSFNFFCFKYPIVPPTIRQMIDTPANAPMTFGKIVDCFGLAMAAELVEVFGVSDVKLDVGAEVGGEKDNVVVGEGGASVVEDNKELDGREEVLIVDPGAGVNVEDGDVETVEVTGALVELEGVMGWLEGGGQVSAMITLQF